MENDVYDALTEVVVAYQLDDLREKGRLHREVGPLRLKDSWDKASIMSFIIAGWRVVRIIGRRLDASVGTPSVGIYIGIAWLFIMSFIIAGWRVVRITGLRLDASVGTPGVGIYIIMSFIIAVVRIIFSKMELPLLSILFNIHFTMWEGSFRVLSGRISSI